MMAMFLIFCILFPIFRVAKVRIFRGNSYLWNLITKIQTMKKIIICLAFFVFVVPQFHAQLHAQHHVQLPAQGVAKFWNPVIRGDVADPSVIRFGGRYYATGTSSEWAPHYPVFESRDLVNWTQVGHVFNKKPEWTVNSFWAPELFVSPTSGRVFCYYTARQASTGISYIGVASARSPRHEFTDHGPIIEYGSESIDAFVWADGDQLYISWKAYGLDDRPIEILGSRLSADGLRLEGAPFTMLRDDQRLGMEGQYHFRRGDWWYIVYAARGCCGPGSDYEVWVARSKNVTGPYEKFEGNPILWAGVGDFMSCGHGTAVTVPDGRMFYMCHAYTLDGGFFLGRQPILQQVTVNDDGWVEFVGGKTASMHQPLPFKGRMQKPAVGFEDKFNCSRLRHDWTWNYPWSDVSATKKRGKLLLTGTPNERNPYGSVLCIRASATDYDYETTVAGSSESVQGLTMYGDARNLVFFATQGSRLYIKVVDDGRETTLWEEDFFYPPQGLRLRIEVRNGCELSFSYSTTTLGWIPTLDEPLDRSKLVRWDRVARPGLIHIGAKEAPAVYSDFICRTRF
jgi:beta-xylosidase